MHMRSPPGKAATVVNEVCSHGLPAALTEARKTGDPSHLGRRKWRAGWSLVLSGHTWAPGLHGTACDWTNLIHLAYFVWVFPCQMEFSPKPTGFIYLLYLFIFIYLQLFLKRTHEKRLEISRISGESAGRRLEEPSDSHTKLAGSFTLSRATYSDISRLANGARGIAWPESRLCDGLRLTALLNLPPAQSKTPVKHPAKKILHCHFLLL